MFQTDLFAGETAVVTGASRGIGRAIAEALARHGADVVLAARSVDVLQEVAADLEAAHDVRTLAVPTDVRSADDVTTLAEEASAFGDGAVEIVIANAGANFHVLVAEMSPNAWQTIVNINLTGTFLCLWAFDDALSDARNGRVITLSSIYGRDGHPESAHYAAAKAGIETLTRTTAMEWADRNVRVNCIRPGIVATPGVEDNRGISADDIDRSVVDREIGDPEEIADLAVFLVSPAASYITGQTYTAEGVPKVAH